MATTKLLFAGAAALAVLLALLAAPMPAGASLLIVYEGPGCTGSFQACWNGMCCSVNYTGSHKFIFNDGWPAYLFAENEKCSGSSNWILTEDVPCTDVFYYKSVQLVDVSGFSEKQLIKLPRAVAAGKK